MAFKTLIVAATALALIPTAAATEIAVTYSDDFIEELESEYGIREGDYLAAEVREDLTRELSKRGATPARIDVKILDAKPNKPTMKQLGKRPGLDYGRSVSLGGMELQATAYSADGQPLGELEYDWFERDIANAFGSTTWWDACRASSRFASRFAKQLAQ